MPRKKKTEAIEEKKEEIASETPKKSEEKASESKRTGLASEKEEFPNLNIGIDVFASPVSGEIVSDKGAKEEKIKELKEKAKKLAEKIEEKNLDIIELTKKKVKKEGQTLFPLDDYVKYSCHLGTKAITPTMRQYVYKRRADGLAVLNTNSIDEKLKEACEFLAGFKAEDIFLVCKREVGWPAAKKFSEATGIRVFTKKYPAGIITNTQLTDFFETELVIVCDPWLDKNAINDAVIIKKPVIALCDTNNLTNKTTKVIPCNNKAGKSIGVILYLLAREYLKARGIEKEIKLEDFAGKLEDSQHPTKELKEDREGRIIEGKVGEAVKEGV